MEDLIQRHLDIPFRESHDATDTAAARAIGDEDRRPGLEPTHARVMRGLVAERDRYARSEGLISPEESR